MTQLTTSTVPHVVLVPLLAPGHMIPMVDLARLLAEHGVRISLITTPINAARIQAIIQHVQQSGLPIQFVEFAFPSAEYGLPDGCENFDLLLPSLDFYMPFFRALLSLSKPLELFLRAQHPRPYCVIADKCNPWVAGVASRLSIPRLVFHGPSCFYLLAEHNLARHQLYNNVVDEFEPFLVPDFPVRVETNKAESPGFFNWPGWEKYYDMVIEAESTANGVVINTFDDLEPRFIESYKKVMGKKVWTIGPVCLHNKDDIIKLERGKKAAVDRHQVMAWLDTQEPRSVLYVSFGSIACLRPKQFIELGSGLEAAGWHFIWVVKEFEKVAEVEQWLAEFEVRTRGRGLIISGWAPQLVILNHHAVGGFLTHCGWNSTLEAVCAGVPMITWPHLADQFLNEKLVVDVLEIGVAAGMKVPAWHLNEDCKGSPMREDIERAMSRVMGDGEEGQERRERAQELAAKAQKAMEEGGSSHANTRHLIEHLVQLYNKNAHTEREGYLNVDG